MMKLQGFTELDKSLAMLGGKKARQITRRSINASLTPVVKRARQLAKSQFNGQSIARLIKKKTGYVRSDKSRVYGMVFVSAKTDRTIQLQGRTVPFNVVANILEFGSQSRNITPKSFMRRARIQTEYQSLKALEDKFIKEVEKEWAKK